MDDNKKDYSDFFKPQNNDKNEDTQENRMKTTNKKDLPTTIHMGLTNPLLMKKVKGNP